MKLSKQAEEQRPTKPKQIYLKFHKEYNQNIPKHKRKPFKEVWQKIDAKLLASYKLQYEQQMDIYMKQMKKWMTKFNLTQQDIKNARNRDQERAEISSDDSLTIKPSKSKGKKRDQPTNDIKSQQCEKQQTQKNKIKNTQNQLRLLQQNSKNKEALLVKIKADKYKKIKQQRQRRQEFKKRQQKYEKELQQRRKLELTKKIESRQKLVTQLKSISKQPNKFGFRSDFFPQPCKESQLILQQIARLGFRFNKLNPKNTLNLIVLKNMHDRGGLDLLDSQLNYQFQQLKNILNTQYCLFINLSPKCHLKSSTFKQLFLKRMKLLGYELEESVNKSNVDFIHFQFDMLNKKLIYPGNSSSEQLKEILNRLQRASQMQT